MRSKRVCSWAAVSAVLFAGALLAGASAPVPIDIRIKVTVIDPNGKPVANAGVVLKQQTDATGKKLKHPLDIELKTNADGVVDGIQGFIPGNVLVQVIASGFQTWGQVLKVSKPNELVNVKLSPPKSQVTIYD